MLSCGCSFRGSFKGAVKGSLRVPQKGLPDVPQEGMVQGFSIWRLSFVNSVLRYIRVHRGTTPGHYYISNFDRNADLYTGVRGLVRNIRERHKA